MKQYVICPYFEYFSSKFLGLPYLHSHLDRFPENLVRSKGKSSTKISNGKEVSGEMEY